MAKFTNKDLRLETGQKITWGNSLNANMWWNGPAYQLGVDVTISGVAPTESYHLATKKYIDDEILAIVPPISDHGGLTGLGDDDHPQYVLVDGARGFTNTISGIAPVNAYDLATKAYVDSSGSGTTRKGRMAIPNYASAITVDFSDLGHTNYTVNVIMENTIDSPSSIYMFIVSAKTTSSFTAIFTGDMDSANYILDWTVVED
jgi:hypothetical protein